MTTSRATLADLGFTVDQELVYRRLLGDGWSDLATLSERTGLDSAHLQNCLDALAERDVIRLDGDAVTLPDPRASLGALIERLEDELMMRYRRISAMRTEIAHFTPPPATPAGGARSDVERVVGVTEVRDRIAELAFFARESVQAIHPGGPQSAASIEASRPLDRRAARRGMRVQVIHERAVLEDELNRAYLQELATFGIATRVSDSLPKRVVILDEEVAVVPIDPADSKAGALIVRQPGLVAGLVDLFQRAWEAAEDITFSPPAPSEGEIDELDRRLLVLLASGCTDEAAAREFGLSVRHLRRRIARLMAALGAHSRFEAGAEAIRRGWL